MQSIKASFLFPQTEYFNELKAGAITNWVECYLNISSSSVKWNIFADSNNNPIKVDPKVKGVSHKTVQLFESLLFKNKEGILWSLFAYSSLRKSDLIIVENRPHYCSYLRKFGYKGKIILHMHNDFLSNFSPQYLNQLHDDVDNVICVSQAIANNYEKIHPPLFLKTVVIPNAVDENLFHYSKHDTHNTNSILYVGRIVEEKGIHILIGSFKKLLLEYPHLQLFIAGDLNADVSYSKELQEQSTKNITFLGRVDRKKDLPQLFKKATILCLPTIIKEALPSVVIEAALSGTSIVSSNHAGSIEACDGNGFFCKPNDSDDLYDTLLEALNDQSKRSDLSYKAYDFAKKSFSWKTVSNDFNKNLITLLN